MKDHSFNKICSHPDEGDSARRVVSLGRRLQQGAWDLWREALGASKAVGSQQIRLYAGISILATPEDRKISRCYTIAKLNTSARTSVRLNDYTPDTLCVETPAGLTQIVPLWRAVQSEGGS